MTEPIDVRTITQREAFSTPDNKGKLVCSTSLPSLEGHDRINAFYCSIADACLDYCRGELFNKYSAERDGAWELRYRLVVSARPIESNVAVTLDVTLSDAFAHKLLAKHKESHFWSLEHDRLMPPRRAKKR